MLLERYIVLADPFQGYLECSALCIQPHPLGDFRELPPNSVVPGPSQIQLKIGLPARFAAIPLSPIAASACNLWYISICQPNQIPSMIDHLTKDKRSWNMSRIRDRHTKPELIVRSLLHRCGFRFRINYDKLPGTPDIVLPKYRTAVFVHGCFWHRHQNCPKATMPNTNRKYWQKKFQRNLARDVKIRKEIKDLYWHAIVVWECEILKDPLSVMNFIITQFENHNCTNYLKEIDHRKVMKIAEKRNHYYLNKMESSHEK